MLFEYELIKFLTCFGSVILVNSFLPEILLKKYKLKKYNFVNNMSEVELPPKLLECNDSLDEQKIVKKKYAKELLEISNKMLKILPDTRIFLRSINDVKIKKLKYKHVTYNSVVIEKGFYRPKRNIIQVENPIYLPHELFHLSSSYFDITKNILYSGFSQVNNKTKTIIGKCLNEGYTALLDERYFKSGSSGYVLEKHFANILEMIVDEKKMFKLYCKADLQGLIVELSKYAESENVIRFINDYEFLDLSKMVKLDKNFINKKLQSIVKFLTESYLNKILSNIPFEFTIFPMMNFLQKIGSGFTVEDKEFSYFEPDYLENLLDRLSKAKQCSGKIIIF